MAHASISCVNTMIVGYKLTWLMLWDTLFKFLAMVRALVCISVCIICIHYNFLANYTPPVNQLTGSYYCSVTGYDLLASFTALATASTHILI